ncbi:L-threonylcarbamoyladenylate synthase [Nanoarchaeota archaeon]
MQIITKSAFLEDEENSIERLRNEVFIYPTDTLYGLGCNAEKPELVNRIREIKDAYDQPFSVIAPSKDWIKENLGYKEEFDRYLEKLPGPYTLIMDIRNKSCVSLETTASKESLGVRIPDNWFTEIVNKAGIPIITTSVNRHGEAPVTEIDNVPENIKSKTDFAIDDGKIEGSPSTLINLTRSPPEMIERK